MEIRPDYYDDFKCIAGECQHNCCIGWEIDIDDDTLLKYNNATSCLKAKLQQSIIVDLYAHFALTEDERCPFLNSDNLCELILYGGEDMLCQICRDHPRFYNEVYGIIEKGIGLCCEGAANIILTKTARTTLVADEDKTPQNDFYAYRNRVFAILQDRGRSLNDRIDSILDLAGSSLEFDGTDWIDVYKNLERLDAQWDICLDSITQISDDIHEKLEIPCEQLIWYFIYRHLSGAIDDFMFCERIQFAILSCYVINSVNKTGTINEMQQVARMYSSEIEYSDENVKILLEKLQEMNASK
ncbi:MAG: flagellin lysine-N-methylase [Clostridia bacterium]|nr:flagellin lysine-N-methylase [Clostridia bacterium]MBQ7106658.1 flagellin lysine-N-methylase [Clostridia bacterium]